MTTVSSHQDSFQNFKAQGYNRIPLVEEVTADLETPLSVYLKLASGPKSYLFESIQGGEKWGRYSIIGLPSKTTISVRGNQICFQKEGKEDSFEHEAPLDWIAEHAESYRVPAPESLLGEPIRFFGGFVGYFGYDTVRYVEKHLENTCPEADSIGVPDILLMRSDELAIFDNLRGRLYLIVYVDADDDKACEKGQARLRQLTATLQKPMATPVLGLSLSQRQVQEQDFTEEFSQKDFMQAVERIKEYIYEGDVMQTVLSQRMSIQYLGSSLNVYRALRHLNPSPYLYYLDCGEFQVVGSSPEILAREEAGDITVRPLAGTRPRGQTESDDLTLEKDLLNDPKEIAEHLMLIDLGRNDVGRVALPGSVKVTEQMAIERYSHVMHIVSNVVGRLNPELSAMEVLKATLPAGTLSGAPKVRAMEIIDELEPVKRGIYGGAVGYLGFNGNLDLAIAIRTAVIKDSRLSIQVGAGVVADSVPEKEWEETMNKGRALFKAVALAEKGMG